MQLKVSKVITILNYYLGVDLLQMHKKVVACCCVSWYSAAYISWETGVQSLVGPLLMVLK